ncbi:hypothetical protein [Tsukamurella soli]|uniref:Uncharacterized protein n=1 Tax=Tsukamurella soli TaxID=644556 RepID=A0ABP8J639_9ACTN
MYVETQTTDPCPVCGGLLMIRRAYTEADGNREWQTPYVHCRVPGHFSEARPTRRAATHSR